MFEFSLLSAAKEQRPASSCQSAIFGKIGKNSLNLAGMILHNSVQQVPVYKVAYKIFHKHDILCLTVLLCDIVLDINHQLLIYRVQN